MLEQGVFRTLRPDAIFGLHVTSSQASGHLAYRPGPAMASADRFRIVVRGRQTHGSRPWAGVDPITVSAQVVLALQTISSRQVDVTHAPSVISLPDGSVKLSTKFTRLTGRSPILLAGMTPTTP